MDPPLRRRPLWMVPNWVAKGVTSKVNDFTPGYGKSRPPNRTFPPNFFERDAQAAMKFMQSIGHDKFSILGWSGTYICLGPYILITLNLPNFCIFDLSKCTAWQF